MATILKATDKYRLPWIMLDCFHSHSCIKSMNVWLRQNWVLGFDEILLIISPLPHPPPHTHIYMHTQNTLMVTELIFECIQGFDILSVETNVSLFISELNPEPAQDNIIKFTLITRRGNKQQVCKGFQVRCNKCNMFESPDFTIVAFIISLNTICMNRRGCVAILHTSNCKS